MMTPQTLKAILDEFGTLPAIYVQAPLTIARSGRQVIIGADMSPWPRVEHLQLTSDPSGTKLYGKLCTPLDDPPTPTGYVIEVETKRRGGLTDLANGWPKLASGDQLLVVNVHGRWWAIREFDAFFSCVS